MTLTELGDVIGLTGVAEVDLMREGIGDEGVARLPTALKATTSVTYIELGSE